MNATDNDSSPSVTDTATEAGAAAPNIVLIQADQLVATALGAYGNTVVQSPEIDALAADGIVFERAYCNSPLCAPSRASMMTGLLPSQLGAFDNAAPFSSTVPTFAHYLRVAGYHTALVGRMHFIGPDQLHGFEQRATTDVYPAGMDMIPDWRPGPPRALGLVPRHRQRLRRGAEHRHRPARLRRGGHLPRDSAPQ